MNKRKMVVANWKMNLSFEEVKDFIEILLEESTTYAQTNSPSMCVCAPFVYLQYLQTKLEDSPFLIGAQNCHHKTSGAYTGEVSASMLSSLNVNHVIVGHSERREYFGEDGVVLKEKVETALTQGLKVIFCVGEKIEQREGGETLQVVENQIKNVLHGLKNDDFENIIIAYEPVWAIGTGRTASPEQAQEVHQAIRKFIAVQWNISVAESTPILYGGSCKPNNAKELFSLPDIDGGLIGGASLNPKDFLSIASSF